MEHLLSRVDEEKLFKHILKLEGPNHPIYSPERLDSAADYIGSELQRYGILVYERELEINDHVYRNVEGIINAGENPEIIITSHYDTVYNSPGADDNLSGVSVMLEAARILSKADVPLNIRVISFTLEEYSPFYIRRTIDTAQKLGLMNENYRFTKLKTQRLWKKFNEYVNHGRSNGRDYAFSAQIFLDDFKEQMSEDEFLYFQELEGLFRGISLASTIGELFCIGSSFWVENELREKNVAGVLNLDTVGYTSDKSSSQSYPAGMSPDVLMANLIDDTSLFRTYLVEDPSVGNFLAVVGDVNSEQLMNAFIDACKKEDVSLPCMCFQVPMSYEDIAETMFDLLRTDHAPFWRKGVPALNMSDTANFRYPYYHTQADTIDKLDFGFMAKICRAIIAMAIGMASQN